MLECSNPDIVLYKMDDVLSNDGLKSLMRLGWIIINNWIDNVHPIRDVISVVTGRGVSFRLVRGMVRLIVTADTHVFVPTETIPNVDADEPGTGGYHAAVRVRTLGDARRGESAGYQLCAGSLVHLNRRVYGEDRFAFPVYYSWDT